MSLTSESRVRVRYAETDQMGVVYHANYLVWFEVGRVDLIRSLGLDYKSMEQQEGVGIAVVEAVVRYKAPARYDDELIVRTTLAHTRGSIVAFDYKLHRAEDDLLLAEGSTTHIVVDREMKRAAMPERCAHAFSAPSSAQPHRA
jgi:acyl-CoA thioester hydrolase